MNEMQMAQTHQLSELIDSSDVAVRAASELRLLAKGVPVRDSNAVEKAKRLIDEAIAGGRFISTGESSGLHASLRPLTWIADVRSRPLSAGEATHASNRFYDELVAFLTTISTTLGNVVAKTPAEGPKVVESAEFMQRLGDELAMRADRKMRLFRILRP